MHYHLEIILPPTDDVEAAIKQIMAPFDEDPEDPEDRGGSSFWDFYVIGGRWAGEHMKADLDPKKLDEFYEELTKRKVTVSGLTAGKQELQPADQIPMVDALWQEFFPDAGFPACPIFRHYNDQYKNTLDDVCNLSEIPDSLAAGRLIIAGPGYSDDGGFRANYMLQDEFWNGCNHIKTGWDGNVKGGVAEFEKWAKDRYTEEAQRKYIPTDDWLVATVDYHS